jgi:hypothetical protein
MECCRARASLVRSMKETLTPALRSRRRRDAFRHVAAFNRPESVGYLMSALHDRGVGPHRFDVHDTALVGGGEQFPVQRLDQLRAAAPGQLADRRLVGHRRLQADPAEPPPADRVADLDVLAGCGRSTRLSD